MKAGFDVVGVWKEAASGAKDDRAQRKKVMALAQARDVDVVLVTELTRWGRSTIDLFHTLGELQAWGISLIAQTGLQFDLGTPQGKLIASLMSVLAEFERDLLRERVRSGIAAAQARGVRFGRQPGQRVKADRHQKRALELVAAGCRAVVPGGRTAAGHQQITRCWTSSSAIGQIRLGHSAQ